MEFTSVIKGTDLKKRYSNFELNIPDLRIPQGLATALIGENGAGKTTLLNMLSGTKLDFEGDLTFFEKYSNDQKEKDPKVKNRIGYTGPGRYYLPNWSVKDIEVISETIFDDFDAGKFERLCEELALFGDSNPDWDKKMVICQTEQR